MLGVICHPRAFYEQYWKVRGELFSEHFKVLQLKLIFYIDTIIVTFNLATLRGCW